MVTLNTLYDAANGDAATPDTAPLNAQTAGQLLTDISARIGVDAEILQSTFGTKLEGLTKDQAVAMLYQLLNAIDTNDTTDEIELEGGEITAETFKQALVTELGIEEGQLDDALTDFNSVFEIADVTFEGQNTADITDDSVTTTEDITQITTWKLPDAVKTALFQQFGGYEFGYQPPVGDGVDGQVIKIGESGNADGNGGGGGQGGQNPPAPGTPDEG